MDRPRHGAAPMYGAPFAGMQWTTQHPPSPHAHMAYGMPMPAPPSAYPSFAAPPPLTSQPHAFASTSHLPAMPLSSALPMPPTRAAEPDLKPPTKAPAKKAAPAPKAAKRKRQRVMHSCLPCHQLKRKCDRGRPCGRCVSLSMTGDCVYETEDPAAARSYDPGAPDAEHTRLRNRISELEAVVRSLKDHNRGAARSRRGSIKRARNDGGYGSDETGYAYEDEAVEMESYSSPRGSGSHETSIDIDRKPTQEELDAVAPATPGRSISHEHFQPKMLEPKSARTGFYFLGAGAAPLMIQQLNNELGGCIPPETAFVELCPRPSPESLSLDWSGPTGRAPAIRHITDGLDLTAAEADTLFAAFKERIDCLHHAWHTPLLQHKWQSFFARAPGQRHDVDEPTLALILAVLALGYLAAASTKTADCRRAKVDEYMTQARCVLDVIGADLNPSIETIQARICVGIACVETGRAGLWAIELPSVIRQAQMLGLHVDPSKLFSEQPWAEQEIRRRIWWTLQSHDANFASLTGMPTSSPANDCDQPQDRSDDSLSGPNVRTGSTKLPDTGVLPESFHIYRAELTLYTRGTVDSVFGNNKWSWQHLSPEEAVPTYWEVEQTQNAIMTWIGQIPPGLRFMVEQRDFVDFPAPLSGTTELDVLERRPSLLVQSLSLCIATHDTLLNLHRPFLQLLPVHDARDHRPVHPNGDSIEQCFYSAHTIARARLLLHKKVPDLPTPYWVNLHTYHAALTLAYFALRVPNLFHAQYAIEDIKLLADAFDKMRAPYQPTVDCLSDSLAAIERALPCVRSPSYTADDFRTQPKTPTLAPPPSATGSTHPIGTFPLPPQPPPLARSPSAGLHSPVLQRTPSVNAADLKLAPIIHNPHRSPTMPAIPSLHGHLRNSYFHPGPPTSADRGEPRSTGASAFGPPVHVQYHAH